MNNPGLKLKRSLEQYMERILNQAELMAPSELAFKKFRKTVLDSGNDLIREFNEEMTKHRVRFPISRKDLKGHTVNE